MDHILSVSMLVSMPLPDANFGCWYCKLRRLAFATQIHMWWNIRRESGTLLCLDLERADEETSWSASGPSRYSVIAWFYIWRSSLNFQLKWQSKEWMKTEPFHGMWGECVFHCLWLRNSNVTWAVKCSAVRGLHSWLRHWLPARNYRCRVSWSQL